MPSPSGPAATPLPAASPTTTTPTVAAGTPTAAAPPPVAPLPTVTAIPTVAPGSVANSIPLFDTSGVLPPFIGANPAIQAGRAPYRTTLLELVDRFATSPTRKAILEGFLNHRDALQNLGFTGFQWLDGSFLEDIETTEGRPPRDIDVVSILFPPAAFLSDMALFQAAVSSNPDIFVPDQSKLTYRTDARYVNILAGPESTIKQTAYWFGLFSHRRADRVWKGMLEVPLNSAENPAAARTLLASR